MRFKSTIGDHAVIAAGTIVTAGSQIPAGAIMAGIPAKLIKQLPLPSTAEPVDRQSLITDADHS
jgi:acetyltransferase-like isoleucine patch superfamily enzyme